MFILFYLFIIFIFDKCSIKCSESDSNNEHNLNTSFVQHNIKSAMHDFLKSNIESASDDTNGNIRHIPGVPLKSGSNIGDSENPNIRVTPFRAMGSTPLEPTFDFLPPGASMDYRVWVDSGEEECYYQYVRNTSQLYVSFQVISGGDLQAGFAVRHPSGKFIHQYRWMKQSEVDFVSDIDGYYMVCVDNQFSRATGKLVNLYIAVLSYDEWDKFNTEINEYNGVTYNFTDILTSIDQKIQISKMYLSRSRSSAATDWLILSSNNTYVTRWSLVQCLLIVLTSFLQVAYVRKLFSYPTRA